MKQTRRQVSRGLARAFLASTWTVSDLVAFGARAMLPPHPWLEPLARDVRARFDRPPIFESLWRYIHDHPELEDIEARAVLRRLFMPAARMHASRWPVPIIRDFAELARWLEMPPLQLSGWADVRGYLDRAPPGPLHHYVRYFRGDRLIEAPKQQLAKLQRRILRGILERIPVHPAAHGFLRGRSFVTNAAAHAGKDLVLRFDLRRFFPSITAPRVRAVFLAAGYPEVVAATLAGLTTTTAPAHVTGSRLYRTRHLPQGAPTSPYLANLIAFSLDVRLSGLSDRFVATYTRYADDLVFSLDHEAPNLPGAVRVIVADEGFQLHPDKTRWMRKHTRQTVTGLVVNEAPAVSKRERKRLEAILYNLARDGIGGADAGLRERLLGHIAHVEHAQPQHGRRLRALFDQIAWPVDRS